ncbi:hypothetical protein BTA51_29365 [Hahella sp. CCB-MM4]|uniref:RidA family protein n=1 Tax=Hahella sp. (strain CCB-MM4) TaxID=1926491 RepID=UPI000B9BE774|nr:RidA family protein [Hahella sp. CCB-MM4]OZG69736.1 hypothetical protein BTA51_29365 [Hahella sp. CCB-MM4]
MSIKNINPAELYDGAPSGMSHAKIDTGLGLVFVSGQVDWSPDYEIKNTGIEAQTEGASRNLLKVLEAANSSAENILQLRVYVRGEVAEHIEKLVPIIVRHLGISRPALTGIGVASLATPDTLIEIEAVAKVY